MSMTVVAMIIMFFPNRLDPLDRILSNLLDGLTWGAISTTPRVAALRVVSTSCHEHDSRYDDDRFLPNRLDPLDWILSTLLDGLTWGAILTTPRVVALGVVLTSCHRHDSCTTMIVFFPNWLDPLDRIISNLLDGFLWGAISTTSRVVTPEVVSTT
jgi:hypothetical protein